MVLASPCIFWQLWHLFLHFPVHISQQIVKRHNLFYFKTKIGFLGGEHCKHLDIFYTHAARNHISRFWIHISSYQIHISIIHICIQQTNICWYLINIYIFHSIIFFNLDIFPWAPLPTCHLHNSHDKNTKYLHNNNTTIGKELLHKNNTIIVKRARLPDTPKKVQVLLKIELKDSCNPLSGYLISGRVKWNVSFDCDWVC